MNRNTSFLFKFFFCILIFPHTLQAFESDSTRRPNGIYVNAGQLGLGELNIEYERFLFNNRPRLSLSGELGYKFYQWNKTVDGLNDNVYADLFGYFWSKSIYCSISTRIYTKNNSEKKSPYFECSLFFRDNFFDRVLVRYGKVGDNGLFVQKIQSANEQVYGAKLIWGTKTKRSESKHFIFSTNCFLGVGIRFKYVNKTTFEEIDDPSYFSAIYNPPGHENYLADFSSHFPLSFQVGLKLEWESKK